jgi:hypothetical protein
MEGDSKIGVTAAALMDDLEETFGDGEIGDVLIVAEFEHDGETYVRSKCSTDRGVIRAGLVSVASKIERWE